MGILTKTHTEQTVSAELFQRVSDVCAVVTAALNEQDFLQQSLEKTLQLFGAGRGSIFLLEENGKDLVLKVAQGMRRGDEEIMIKRLGEGIVGHVARRKLPIFVDDIENDVRFHAFKARKSYRTPSFICAPLMIKDKLVGVINISDKESGLRFDKNEMQLLDFLASQIALNHKRIQLYQKFKSIVKETQDLKNQLGQSNEEARHLKKQVVINERLATLGKLAGGIAHEFNNPLDGVMRYTNLCLEHIRDDEVLRGYLLEMKHGLNRMAGIVKNLLDCSRNSAPASEWIDFKKALESSLAGIQAEINCRHITVEQKIAEDLPLIADLGLERILINLLRNAVDAIADRGTITVEAKCQNNMLHIKVCDTGVGIPPEETEKIFEPFYTTKSVNKGCGLGLTIVAEIVKSYNGSIHVESRPGQETAFFVNLPAAR